MSSLRHVRITKTNLLSHSETNCQLTQLKNWNEWKNFNEFEGKTLFTHFTVAWLASLQIMKAWTSYP